jgi:hypothetical protein
MPNAYFRWKEQLVYEDDNRVLVFEAPMGVTPHPVYVPTADAWSGKVPAWAHDKRDEVLRTLRGVPGLGDVIEDASASVEVHTW